VKIHAIIIHIILNDNEYFLRKIIGSCTLLQASSTCRVLTLPAVNFQIVGLRSETSPDHARVILSLLRPMNNKDRMTP